MKYTGAKLIYVEVEKPYKNLMHGIKDGVLVYLKLSLIYVRKLAQSEPLHKPSLLFVFSWVIDMDSN